MPGYSVTYAINNISTGEYDEVFAPRSPRKNRFGCVLVHGSGAPGEFIDVGAQPSSVKLAAALASAGIPCIAGDLGSQTWGNDTVVSRIDAAWAVLQSRFGVRSDKIILLGASMGGAGCAHYCQANPTKVAAFVGLIPLLDLVAFYTANVGGTQSAVAGAWGVTAPAALPTRADIAAYASLAAGIPTLLGYSSVDTTVLPAWVTAYGTAVGATMVVTDSTYGHSDQAIGGMPIATVGSFMANNGA